MPSSLSPERARQLIEWPTYEAIGVGNSNEPRCVDCHQRPSEHGDNCKIAQRNTALERLAVLEARVAEAIDRVDSVSQCWRDESQQAGFHPPSGTMHCFLSELRHVLKGDDQ